MTRARLQRLARELRALRAFRDELAKGTGAVALRAGALRAAFTEGAASDVELEAIIGIDLTAAQWLGLQGIAHQPLLVGRLDGVHPYVARNLVDRGLARRDGYWVGITSAGREALRGSAPRELTHPGPGLVRVRWRFPAPPPELERELAAGGVTDASVDGAELADGPSALEERRSTGTGTR